jgi:hypothetical protein
VWSRAQERGLSGCTFVHLGDAHSVRSAARRWGRPDPGQTEPADRRARTTAVVGRPAYGCGQAELNGSPTRLERTGRSIDRYPVVGVLIE